MEYLESISFNYGLLKKYEGAYKTLGLKKTCTEKEVKQAYRDLSRKYHPDKGGNEKLFNKVAEAKELILDKDENQYRFKIVKMKSVKVGSNIEYGQVEGRWYYKSVPVYQNSIEEESYTGTKFQYYVEQSKYATEILNSDEHQFVAENLNVLLNVLGGCPDQLMNKARSSNNIKEIVSLIEKGVYVDTSDNNGNTLLMFAAKRGYVDLVEMLIKKDVDIRAVNKKGETAAHFARSAEKLDVLVKLVEDGSDVKMADSNGNTLLMFAAKRGHVDLVKTLLDKGANTKDVNKKGETAAHFARSAEKIDVLVKLVKAGSDVKMADDNGNTLLMFAAKRGHVDLVKTLLGKGANTKDVNKKGETAANFARLAEKLDVLVKLVKGGSEVEMADSNGNTLLMFAAKRGHVDLMKALLEKGANVNAVNKKGETAAHFSQGVDGHKHSELFLSYGIDIKNIKGADNAIKSFCKDPIKFTLNHHTKTTEAIKVIDHYIQEGRYPSVEAVFSAAKECLETKNTNVEYDNLAEICGVSNNGVCYDL